MRWLGVIVHGVLAACSHQDDVNPLVDPKVARSLVFVERTIPLDPVATSPTFTMPVPETWQKRGDGKGDPEHDSFALYGDPTYVTGYFQLSILCPGACGEAEEKRVFAQWSAPEIVDETRSATEHVLITRREAGMNIVRTWHTDRDPRIRMCWATVMNVWAGGIRAFSKACSEVVEKAP